MIVFEGIDLILDCNHGAVDVGLTELVEKRFLLGNFACEFLKAGQERAQVKHEVLEIKQLADGFQEDFSLPRQQFLTI